jgi:pyruvate-ferredoxin/flavodoxin oxidoreductase
LEGEVRFLSLKKAAPAEAQELYDACKAAAKRRYNSYIRMSKMDYSDPDQAL